MDQNKIITLLEAVGSSDAAAYPNIDTRKGGQFRIIRLHPGQFRDPIRIDLFTEELFNQPEYDALSYVWGKEISELPVTVNGRVLNVTTNLDIALRHLRYNDAVRTLWVDAICINQRIPDERYHQVRLMGNIYSSARRVIVWLGPAEEESDMIIDWILGKVGIPGSLQMLMFRFGLRALCGRPWFSRVWVVQEVALATEDPVVVCGSKHMPWLTFMRFLVDFQSTIIEDLRDPNYPCREFKETWEAFIRLSHRYGRDIELRQTASVSELRLVKHYSVNSWLIGHFLIRRTSIELGEAIRKIAGLHRVRSTQRRSCLETQMYRTRHLRATDPHDKIYALLGVSRSQGPPIQPDYSRPLPQLFSEAMKGIIQHRFQYGYPCFPLLSHAMRPLNWPSWVPGMLFDINIMPGTDPTRLCPGHQVIESLVGQIRNSMPIARFSDDMAVLTTVGIELGEVVAVDSLTFHDSYEVLPELKRLNKLIRGQDIPPAVILDAIIEEDDRFRSFTEEERMRATTQFSNLWDYLSKREIEHNTYDEFSWVCEIIAQRPTYDRTLLVSDSGRIGISPKNRVQPGDQLVGLFGINFPMILRWERSPGYTMVCVTHLGCHEWGHEFLRGNIDYRMLSKRFGMKVFKIH